MSKMYGNQTSKCDTHFNACSFCSHHPGTTSACWLSHLPVFTQLHCLQIHLYAYSTCKQLFLHNFNFFKYISLFTMDYVNIYTISPLWEPCQYSLQSQSSWQCPHSSYFYQPSASAAQEDDVYRDDYKTTQVQTFNIDIIRQQVHW